MSFKKSLLTYSLFDIVSRAIALIISPITTRLFTMNQYGVTPLLTSIWAPFSILQYGGMDWAYPFFFARKNNDTDKKRLTTNASFLAYVFTIIIWSIFLIFALLCKFISKFAGVKDREVLFFALGILPGALIYWICYLLRFQHRADAYAKISLLCRIFPSIVTIPFLFYFEQEIRLQVSYLLASLILFITLGYALYEIRRVGHWPFDFSLIDIKLCKEMLWYGIPLAHAGLAYALMVVSDRLLIGYFLDTRYVAIYALAMGIATIGTIFVNWFGLAFDPHLSEWIASKEQDTYLPKLQILAPCLASILGILSCLSAIWSAPIISFVYPEGYKDSAKLIPFIIFSAGITSQSRLAVATAMIAQTAKYHSILYWIALLVNIILGVTLIPIIGILGAAVSTIIAETAILSGWIYLGKIHLQNLKINWKMPITILLFTIAFISLYVNQNFLPHNWYFLITVSLLCTTVIFILAYSAVGKNGFGTLIRYLYK